MAITRQKKEEILTKLKEIVKNSKSVVFLNFHGLKVEEANSLRRELKQSDIGYFVAKKTLVNKALEDSKLKREDTEVSFAGELSLAYGQDSIEPAQKIFSFQKKLENKISITGGIFEQKLIGKEEMTDIAQIPPLEVLYGQFVNIINSPVRSLVFAIKAISESKN